RDDLRSDAELAAAEAVAIAVADVRTDRDPAGGRRPADRARRRLPPGVEPARDVRARDDLEQRFVDVVQPLAEIGVEVDAHLSADELSAADDPDRELAVAAQLGRRLRRARRRAARPEPERPSQRRDRPRLAALRP